MVKSFLGVQDDLLLLSRDEGQLMRMVKERNDNMTASRDLVKRHNAHISSENNTSYSSINHNSNNNLYDGSSSIEARTPVAKQSNESQLTY